MSDQNTKRFPWHVYVAELAGTALLISIGLSIVIFMFGEGSPAALLIPDEGVRRLITGFLFGTTGALIALSPIGRESGAHINPAVTFAFWLMRKLESRVAAWYVLAQCLGAVCGALPLLVWGEMGRSIGFGATLPGQGYSDQTVLLGEAVTTCALITGLTIFLAIRRIRQYTPALFPVLYAIMVYLEAPISGTSTNPARSLGPAVVSGQWEGWWIYWAGPIGGTLIALFVCIFVARHIEVAKLHHFNFDRHGLFRSSHTSSTPPLPRHK